MSRYLITGLPRSRTAWMAAFMSNGRGICRHEPLKNLRDIAEAVDVFRSSRHFDVGISDSSAAFFMPEIIERIYPRILIIQRPLDDVDRSMQKLGFEIRPTLQKMQFKLRDVKDAMRVDYAHLDDVTVMRDIVKHLTPNASFDEERYYQFRDFHIEADIEAAKASAKLHVDQQTPIMKHIARETESCRG